LIAIIAACQHAIEKAAAAALNVFGHWGAKNNSARLFLQAGTAAICTQKQRLKLPIYGEMNFL
jgi:hypothetical protein